MRWEIDHAKPRAYILTYLLFLPILALASLPLWLTMDRTQNFWLGLMVVAILGLGVLVGLRTLVLATLEMGKLTEAHTWDQLVLTHLTAEQLILGKVWLMVRQVWGWHVLLAVVRLGLTLGLAQRFHDDWCGYTNWNNPCPYGLSPFCYVSHNAGDISHYVILWQHLLVVFLSLLIFTLLEMLLLIAIGWVSALLVSSKLHQVVLAIVIRVTFAGISLLAVPESAWNIRFWHEQTVCNRPEDVTVLAYQYRDCLDLGIFLETVQIGLYSPLDSGVLLGTKFLRTHENTYYNGETKRYNNLYLRDIWLNLASSIWGIGLHLLAIWGLLRWAVRIATRRGASRLKIQLVPA